MMLAILNLIPGRVWIGLALAVAAVLAVWLWDKRGDEIARLRQVHEQVEAWRRLNDAADAAERGVLDCPAGKWDREAGRCAK